MKDSSAGDKAQPWKLADTTRTTAAGSNSLRDAVFPGWVCTVHNTMFENKTVMM
jgi:hypothetical protein